MSRFDREVVIVKICYGGATIQKYEYDITVAQK